MPILFKIITVTLLLCCTIREITAQVMSTRAAIYDRGLISQAEPFSPTGNPALLTSRDYLRFTVEHQRSGDIGYQISMSYPLSSRTGLGLAWRRTSHESTHHEFEGIQNQKLERQDLVLSLGHDTNMLWGQYFEFNYENFQSQNWQLSSVQKLVDYQELRVQYRLGWIQNVGRRFNLGIMTPPLVAYAYRSFGQRTDSTHTKLVFGKEAQSNTSMPMVAVEWRIAENWRAVLTNRSFHQKTDAQLAVAWQNPKWDIVQAVQADEASDKIRFLSGAGIYLQGFEVFAGIDITKNYFSIAASFTPERMRALVRMHDAKMEAYQLYPYKLMHGLPDCLARLTVERMAQHPVELNLLCTGEQLPPISQTVFLEEDAFQEIVIPVPANLHRLPKGRYNYHLELIAYSKGKQKIEKELSFEMKGDNDWSGDPNDLIYFLRPRHQPIINQSRQLISLKEPSSKIPTEQMARQFYCFIRDSVRYVPDPRPLHNRSDRGQYPSELLTSRAGDCEDFSILMISLLQSVGIEASFLEYVRPDTDEGHIFIMFDSQKTASQLLQDEKNLQKYIVRNQTDGSESRCFIPLELTQKKLTFEAAWTYALKSYRTLAIEQNGLAEDWFHIIDTW